MSKPWLETVMKPTSSDCAGYRAKVNADGKSTGTRNGLADFAAANRLAALLVDPKKPSGKKVEIGCVGGTQKSVKTYYVATGHKLNPHSK